MAVTIKDIAKIAGVSHTTVSRALHDHPAIAPETIARIKRIAVEQGYMPSAVARGLKTRRSLTLGVIVSDLDDPFWGEVLQGIDDVLHPAGYSLFVAATHRDRQREKEIVDAMVQRRVDGVILCAPQFSAEQSRIFKAYGLPTAVVNNMGAEDYQYSIYNDNIYGIKLATRHLIDLGHRCIAYLGNAIGGRTTAERESGFREEMQAARLEVREEWVIQATEGTPQGGFAAAQNLLSTPEPPSAIVCYNDNMAIGVYIALFQAGLRVPQDVSITGFDNIDIAAYLIPPLTTLHQPKYDLGFGAAEILLSLLPKDGHAAERSPELRTVRLRGELVIRDSTQPPLLSRIQKGRSKRGNSLLTTHYQRSSQNMAQEPAFDVITMGRSSIDLYSNDIGAPFETIKSFSAYVGGSSTNIAVGAQRLGLRTALLTGVGMDLVGDFILHFLQNEGVETKYIPRKPEARSSAVLLGIEPPDRFPLMFFRDNAADIQLTIDDVQSMPLERCRIFQFGGNSLSKEPSRSATIYAVEQARAAGVTVLMDIDFRADQWNDPRAFGLTVRALLPKVDIVLGTEEEVKAAMLKEAGQLRITHSQISAPEVTGDLDAGIQALLESGPQLVVVKRGAKGCSVFQPQTEPLDVPGFPVEVYNVLGAGDAFASGFIFGIIQGWNLYQVGRIANACGAIVVTRHACANHMPRLQEVYDFITMREVQDAK